MGISNVCDIEKTVSLKLGDVSVNRRTERGSPASFFAFLGWLVAGDYTAGQLESERLTGARDTDEPGEPPAYM